MITQRVGLLARKVGMTRVVNNNEVVAVTLLQVDCRVVRHKKEQGRNALQLGGGLKKKVNRALQGYFNKQKSPFLSKLCEFTVSQDAVLPEGAVLKASHFHVGQYVDVTGTSIGKGFAGGMKRWGFGGLPASHGVSVSHRSHGSTGNRKDPGRTFLGKKMAGHMGHRTVTVQNLKVLEVLDDESLIVVAGAVPGAKGVWLKVCDAVKKHFSDQATRPSSFELGDTCLSSEEKASIDHASEEETV